MIIMWSEPGHTRQTQAQVNKMGFLELHHYNRAVICADVHVISWFVPIGRLAQDSLFTLDREEF